MRAGKRPRGCRPWPARSGASRIRPPSGVDGRGNPGDCRDQDGELIDQHRGSLEVAEPKLDERATSFVRRHAVSAHDGTGIGNVVNDLIDERAHKFVMTGRARTELLVEYITAVERGVYRLPANTPAFAAHKGTTVEEVYALGKWNSHLSDDVAAFALADNAADRQAPPAAGEGVPRSAYVSRSHRDLTYGPTEQVVSVTGDVRVVQVDDNPYVIS